ncbi:MAG TPA: sugar ABC transporter substrate-binding protein [Firmicutes bacterium]|nr:sugar ABC transporter substrate-binding protein [Bacillota bacterium]
MLRKGKLLMLIMVFLGFILGQASLSVSSAASTVITYLGRGTPNEKAQFERLVSMFEAANPDIKVQIVWHSGNNIMQQQERLYSMIAAGVAPDVFWAHCYSTADWYLDGITLDITNYLQSDRRYMEDIFPAALADFQYFGKQVGLPRETTVVALFYNKTDFDNAGVKYPDGSWTWDTFLQQAKKLTITDAGGNIVKYAVELPKSTGYYMMHMWQNGSDMLTEDRTKANFSSTANIETTNWIRDLHLVYRVATPPTGGPTFRANLVSMNYQARSYRYSLPDEINWAVSEVPYNKQRATRVASSGYSIYAHTKYPEEAWRFLKFLGSAEAGRVLVGDGTTIPIHRSLINSPEFINSIAPGSNEMVFIDMLQKYGRPEPITRNWTEIHSTITAILNVDFWSGKIPVTEGLANVDNAINLILQRDM